MENSNFKKLSNTLVDYFQRIQNEIDFKGDGFYSKYGRSIKIVLNRTNTLRDLFDALVANEVISPEPTQTSWSFEVTDRIQLVGCAFLYLKINEVAPSANYYRIYAVTDGMKVINTAADHMKTIDYIMGYAESLPNKIPTDSDLVHKTEAETISGQKTFTEKTTFAAETNFNANTIFAGTAQFNGNLKIKNKTIEAIIDERIETNSGSTGTDALLPKTIDLGEIVAGQEYPFPADMTLESFVEIDAVKLTTTIQEMSVSCTLKKSGEVQSAGVMFSAVGMNKLLQFMVTSEVMMLWMTETPSNWWVEELSVYSNVIDINLYRGGNLENEKIYGNKIVLNGITYSPFSSIETSSYTIDIDAAIDLVKNDLLNKQDTIFTTVKLQDIYSSNTTVKEIITALNNAGVGIDFGKNPKRLKIVFGYDDYIFENTYIYIKNYKSEDDFTVKWNTYTTYYGGFKIMDKEFHSSNTLGDVFLSLKKVLTEEEIDNKIAAAIGNALEADY